MSLISVEEETVPDGRSKLREVEQGKEIDGAELAVPRGWAANPGSHRDVGLDKLRYSHFAFGMSGYRPQFLPREGHGTHFGTHQKRG